MRERTIKSINDKLIWFVIYMIPILLYVVVSHHNALLSYTEFLNTTGLNILSTGVIYDTFNSLFGASGILPMFSESSFILHYMTYMVSITLIHITFDVIVFIPRLFHTFMDKLDGGELL